MSGNQWFVVIMTLAQVSVLAIVVRIIWASMRNIERANAQAMMSQTMTLGAINARLAAILEANGIGDPVTALQNAAAVAAGDVPPRESDPDGSLTSGFPRFTDLEETDNES